MTDKRQEWTVFVTPEERVALERVLDNMRAAESNSSAEATRIGKHFLPSYAQMCVYKERVRTYYINHIAEREIAHKHLMQHYAAIYDVLAQRTGIERGTFYGPEFDRFVYDFCNVPYNESGEPKGRYRQVGDVYKKYTRNQGEPDMQEYYNRCVQDFMYMLAHIPQKVSYHSAQVPPKLEDF